MLAFCTNTVQWSALHSNPAIMTAGFVCVCVCVCVCVRAHVCVCSCYRKSKRGKRKKNRTKDGYQEKNTVKPESSEDSVMGVQPRPKNVLPQQLKEFLGRGQG